MRATSFLEFATLLRIPDSTPHTGKKSKGQGGPGRIGSDVDHHPSATTPPTVDHACIVRSAVQGRSQLFMVDHLLPDPIPQLECQTEEPMSMSTSSHPDQPSSQEWVKQSS